MTVLITGASGFLGRPICLAMHDYGFSVRAFSRSHCHWPVGIDSFSGPTISSLMHHSSAFDGVDCVLHLAGRAHVMRETDPNPLESFRKVNFYETIAFARRAALAGVRRFIFVSSIKVNGESTSINSPFTEKDAVSPIDAYALSKYEAEVGLSQLAAETGMELVIIRPPLIYGPHVKGNFKTIIKLLELHVPLPFALITTNRRSYLSLYNLIDFLKLAILHPEASGRVFLLSDQCDISTADLLLNLGMAIGHPARLFPVPRVMLKAAASLAFAKSSYQRLCCSLQVDSSSAFRILGWVPPLTLDEGLRRMVLDSADSATVI